MLGVLLPIDRAAAVATRISGYSCVGPCKADKKMRHVLGRDLRITKNDLAGNDATLGFMRIFNAVHPFIGPLRSFIFRLR